MLIDCCVCSPETYEAVRAGVLQAFPARKAKMKHFDQYLGFKLAEACPHGLRNAVRPMCVNGCSNASARRLISCLSLG